jgi:hypothetical protein
VDPTQNTASNNHSVAVMGGFLAKAQILLMCLLADQATHVPSRNHFIEMALHVTIFILKAIKQF